MALDAAAVALQQDVSADTGILFGDTVALEHIDHEVVHQFPLNIRSGFHLYYLQKRNYMVI
jgi:hypothetical protein